MFSIHCPNHGFRVLLFSSDIEAVCNTRGYIEVHYRCFCGYRGVWLTGRIRSEGQLEESALAYDHNPESA